MADTDHRGIGAPRAADERSRRRPDAAGAGDGAVMVDGAGGRKPSSGKRSWVGGGDPVTPRRPPPVDLEELNEALGAARDLADERELRLRLTLEAAEVGTFDYDLTTGRLVWDDRCRALFGVPAGAPVSYEKTFLPGLHPDDRAVTEEAVAAAFRPDDHGLFDIEYRTIGLTDGVIRWVAAKGRTVTIGSSPRFIGTVRDVTRRRVATALLRETEERYRLAVRATTDAIWDWDLGSDAVLWNEAMTESYGYAPEEIGATGSWWIGHIHPADRERMSASIHAAIDGAAERWSDEYRFRRRDGSYAAIQDRGSVLRNAAGRAVRMVGAMLDVTERQRAQDQQRFLMNELQHRVKNTLAMVQAIAGQTFRSESMTARDAFSNRVIALSHANEVLMTAGWKAASLRDVVMGATIPHCAPAERFSITGPALEIAAQAALALTLALHELCTNASKYGALSSDGGRVAIDWTVADDGTFRLRWAETGGPPVEKPSRVGFGSRLIERSLGPQFGGTVSTDYDPAGVVCTFAAPLASLQEVAGVA